MVILCHKLTKCINIVQKLIKRVALNSKVHTIGPQETIYLISKSIEIVLQ